MTREIQVTFDCADPNALAGFWCEVLGYEYDAPPPGFDTWDAALESFGIPPEKRNDASACHDPDGNGPRLFFQKVPEGKTAKNRVHLDVRAAPGLQGDDRMAALGVGVRAARGARRAARQPQRAGPTVEPRLHRDDRPRGQRVLPGLDQSPGAPHTASQRESCFSSGSSPSRTSRTWISSRLSRCRPAPGSGANG